MLIFLQYPLCDIRDFIEEETGKIPLPSWPAPRPYKEFVREMGAVRRRGKGGGPDWLGENEICDAKSALKFGEFKALKHKGKTIGLACSSRHFYFDGFAVGKFELVMMTRSRKLEMSSRGFHDFVSVLLATSVSIPILAEAGVEPGRYLTRSLYSAGSDLAELYLYSSTRTKLLKNLKGRQWVFGNEPLLFLELGPKEEIEFKNSSPAIDLDQQSKLNLRQYWYRKGNLKASRTSLGGLLPKSA